METPLRVFEGYRTYFPQTARRSSRRTCSACKQQSACEATHRIRAGDIQYLSVTEKKSSLEARWFPRLLDYMSSEARQAAGPQGSLKALSTRPI